MASDILITAADALLKFSASEQVDLLGMTADVLSQLGIEDPLGKAVEAGARAGVNTGLSDIDVSAKIIADASKTNAEKATSSEAAIKAMKDPAGFWRGTIQGMGDAKDAAKPKRRYGKGR